MTKRFSIFDPSRVSLVDPGRVSGLGLDRASGASDEEINAVVLEPSLSQERKSEPESSASDMAIDTTQSNRGASSFVRPSQAGSTRADASASAGTRPESVEAMFQRQLDETFFVAGIVIFTGLCHLNPFSILLALQRHLLEAEMHSSFLRNLHRGLHDRLVRRREHCRSRSCSAISSWCGSTRIGGQRVPWVLWNSTLALFSLVLVYDTIFMGLCLAATVMLFVQNKESMDNGGLCQTNSTFDFWLNSNLQKAEVDEERLYDALGAAAEGSSELGALTAQVNGELEMRAVTVEVVQGTLLQAIKGDEDSLGICKSLLLSNLLIVAFASWFCVVLALGWGSTIKAIWRIRRARRTAPLVLQLHVEVENRRVPVSLELTRLARHVGASPHVSPGTSSNADRFLVGQLVTGRPIDAALGVLGYMGVPEETVYGGLADGFASMVREVEAHGTEEDRYCLKYVLHAATGSCERQWPNGVLDGGRESGLRLADFASHASARLAGLTAAQVAALRFYTTAGYRSLNLPLRSPNGICHQGYPFPVTMTLIAEALKRLRAVDAGTRAQVDLWRGMRNVVASEAFLACGGTEVAPMSTTTDLAVAMRYSCGHGAATTSALLLKIATSSFMDRGADLAFLSCFPNESEVCYPPLTFLLPTGRSEQLQASGVRFTVIEVTPRLS